MESLLPSEVARLVYGYLIEQDCTDAAGKFLETSPHLKECLCESKKGKKFQTKIEGKNLEQILDIVSLAKEQAQLLAEDLSANASNVKLLSLLNLFSVGLNNSQDNKCNEDKKNTEISIEDVSCSEQTDDATPDPIQQEPIVECQDEVDEGNNGIECDNVPDIVINENGDEDNNEVEKVADSNVDNDVVLLSPQSVVECDENDVSSVNGDQPCDDDDESVVCTSAAHEMSVDEETANGSDDDIECITPDIEVIDLDNYVENTKEPKSDLLPSTSYDQPSTSCEPSTSQGIDRRRRKRRRKSKSPQINAAYGINSSYLPGTPLFMTSNCNRFKRCINFQGTPIRFSQRSQLVNPNIGRRFQAPHRLIPPASVPPVPLIVNRQVVRTSSFASALNNAVVTEVAETLAFMAYGGVTH